MATAQRLVPEPLRGRLRHSMPGRARIVLDEPWPDRDGLEHLAQAVAAVPNVQAVEVRPVTGSLIIMHEGPFQPIPAALAEAQLLSILPVRQAEVFDPFKQTIERLDRVDAVVARLTGGRFDLSGAAFVGLLGAGLVQLARGQVAGPAISLFSQAATLALARPPRRKP